MERCPKPDEFVGPDLGRAAVRLLVDELFTRSDAEMYRIFSLYLNFSRGEDNETQDNRRTQRP